MSLRCRYICALLLGLALILALAANLDAATITISPPVVVRSVITYPDNVSKMSKAEFFSWATKRNREAEARWEVMYDYAGSKYLYGSKEIMKTESRGVTTGRSTTSLLGTSASPGIRYSRVTTQRHSVPTRTLNPDFRHPGPLTIINPYVKPK